MRLLLAISLLSAFMLRALVVCSTIAYYRLHVDSIVKNFCINTDKPTLRCQGSCYLNKKLLAYTGKSNTTANAKELLSEVFLAVFYQDDKTQICNLQWQLPKAKPNWKSLHEFYFDLSFDIDPPPKPSTNYFCFLHTPIQRA